MRVIYCEVGKKSVEKEIENTLNEFQSLVDGYIECCYPPEFDCITPQIVIICNEEGKLLKLPRNRVVYDNFKPVDIICGNFVVVCLDNYHDFTDIPDFLIDVLLMYFDYTMV